MNDIFISYSRRNKDFTQKLFECLKAADRTVWADWDSIPASSDWFAEIKEGIEQTDSVVFVLSPDWVKSGECRKELEYALQMGKRLFPILYLPVDPKEVPPELAKINWVYMRDGDDFDKAFQTLCSAMDTDLEWIKTHTRIQVRALEWDKKKRDHSFVLRGNDLSDGEQFIAGGVQKNPEPTVLQGEYVLASRKDANRRSRQTLVGVTIALIVSIVLGVVAFFQRQAAVAAEATAVVQRNRAVSAEGTAVAEKDRAVAAEAEAVTQRDRAVTAEEETKKALIRSESERLAAEAHVILSDPLGNPETAILLSLKALQPGYIPQADAALVDSLQRYYGVKAFTHGPPNEVFSQTYVTISPDGKTVAVASNLATQTKVLLYNSSSGEVEHEFEFVNTTINDIAISPDGKTFAVALGLARAELYTMDTGEKIMEFNGHQDGVLAVAISPDSKTLLTGSRDTTAIVWDIASGQALKTFAGHTNWVLSVAFSPDGNFIYTAGADQFAYKWSIASGTIFGSVFEYNKINDIAVSHDGKLMVTVTDRRAEVWDFTSSKPLFVLNHPDWVNSVSFSPEGNYFVTGGDDNIARIWDAGTGRMVRALVGHTGQIQSLAYSSDGKNVISGGHDSTARIWDSDVESSRWILRGHTNIVTDVAISPDGKTLVTGGWDADLNNAYKVWDMASGKQRGVLLGHTWQSASIAFSSDNRFILTANGDGNLRIWDSATTELVKAFKVGDNIWVNSAVFSSDGKYILAGSDDNTASLWDVETGEKVLTMEHPSTVRSVAISPDGKYAVTGCNDSVIYLWNLQTAKNTRAFEHIVLTTSGYQNIENLAFTPDGQYFISGYDDGTTILWNVDTVEPVHTFKQEGNVLFATVSPDGKYGLTGGSDRIIRLWDLQTGDLVRSYIGHTDSVFGLAFSPDGKFFVSSSADTTVRIWDTYYDDTFQLACSSITRQLTPLELETFSITDDSTVCP